MDKWISRFIWQGRKPRIKYATLQLSKERGGLGLPCLKNYYYAAQITPILFWCSESYNARWKELEANLSNKFPIQAVISDRSLMGHLEKLGNPWLNHTLQVWQKVINACEIQKILRIFRWFAYDSDFIPNRHDSNFKTWMRHGLTTLLSLTQRNTVHSFASLRDKYGLVQEDFYRYLQLRSYIDHTCKLTNLTAVESDFFQILKNALTMTPSKSISKLYTALSHADKNDTLYVKEKWERESGIEISEEAWSSIWSFQLSTSSSMSWREHCWKNVIRFFKTPYQERYKDAHMSCWRHCGSISANHYHIFWECPKLNTFWKGVQASLCKIFNIQVPLSFDVLYLGRINFLEQRSEIKLLQLLLAASKKTITRRWLNPVPPSLDDWIGIILEIFRMEKLTYQLRIQIDKFYKIWNKWIIFVTPKRADFI